MADHPHKVLLVEPDPGLLEILVAELSVRFDAQVTCVSSAEACIDAEMADPHDLIITEMEVVDSQPPFAGWEPIRADPSEPRRLGSGSEYEDAFVRRRRTCAVPGGLRLTEMLTAMSSRPIILLAEAPTCRQAIAALRMGVRELLIKPFPVEQLADAAARLLHGLELHRRHLAKYRRMRELVRRVIRERRDLNQRIELICRDLVGSHRRLVYRVLDFEGNLPTEMAKE